MGSLINSKATAHGSTEIIVGGKFKKTFCTLYIELVLIKIKQLKSFNWLKRMLLETKSVLPIFFQVYAILCIFSQLRKLLLNSI